MSYFPQGWCEKKTDSGNSASAVVMGLGGMHRHRYIVHCQLNLRRHEKQREAEVEDILASTLAFKCLGYNMESIELDTWDVTLVYEWN